MDDTSKSLITAALIGAAIGLGQLASSAQPITWRLALGRAVVSGGLAQGAGGIQSIFDDGCRCSGAVSGLGEPTAATYSGAFNVGDRTKNMVPAVAVAKAWVCTAAGSPGTWTSEGNL